MGRERWCAACEPPRPLAPGETLNGIPLLALGSYEGALASAIRRLKYEPCPALARPLGLELASALANARFGRDTVLAPVPLHPRRLAERGFNQTALVASALSSALGCLSRPRLLARVRETGQQAELGKRARAENVNGAFELSGEITPRVLVLDDVVTTGATVQACVRVLEAVGVNVVAIVALARTPGRFCIS